MAKKVTVFSTTYCASCASLKKWLESKDIAYDSVNLEEHPERQAEVMEKSGTMSVPVTFIQDEGNDDSLQVVNGPNFAEISKALELA